MNKTVFLFMLFFFFAGTVSPMAGEMSLEAEQLFKKYSPTIFQVQSISIKTNKKNSLGTGFQISKEGYIVTNYHVVSDAIMFPGSFRIQTIEIDGAEQSAQVVRFDVVHDIAIIKIRNPQKIELPLGTSQLSKGKRLYSIGNPEDVGMMIVEGVANGYMDKALYKKVLTSLPLNPGMSGGPALDDKGNVVGINVMTAGNSLSFLVPVECLENLWDSFKAKNLSVVGNFSGQVQSQLISQEKDYFKNIINGIWKNKILAILSFPQ